MKKNLSIAILGDRGIPARYGGFSTLIEEVATRLVAGHDMDVTVYCRSNYYETRPAQYAGVRLRHLPAPRSKYFESLCHMGLSVIHAITQRFDAVFVVDPGNAPLMLPLWLLRKPTALHTDGLGWQRRKWGPVASAYYKACEGWASYLATKLVTDARAMQDYYRDHYGSESVFIPYGADVGDPPNDDCLERFGLLSGGYFLVVTRIEPDNNTDLIIREYKAAAPGRPLIIVGGARYPSDYSRAIEAEAGDKVRFLGPLYDSGLLNGLYRHAFAYLHGHEVGGTNPALLRAMHGGAPCVAMDVVFHREALGEQGLFFDREPGRLVRLLGELEASPERAGELGRCLRERAGKRFRWDAVAAAYAELFRQLVEGEPVGEAYRPENFVTSS